MGGKSGGPTNPFTTNNGVGGLMINPSKNMQFQISQDKNLFLFKSIAEEEGESLLDFEEDPDGIKNHRKALLKGVSLADYFHKLYLRLVHRREEERKISMESDISSLECNSWIVYFRVPESTSGANAKMKKFYLKMQGRDVFCVHERNHTIDQQKLKFLHCLVGCSF